ncbi:MAG: preprotein translocase subunit SecA, partial [Oscillospiraceae bacterium]|nr:preprotein translocase subunit SecA [Oscillospiraceae bacterium]
MGILQKLFGTNSGRELRKNRKYTDAVLALESKYAAMSDEELRAQTDALKARLAAGETMEDTLPDAFATVREAEGRVLGYKAFPVQIAGAVILHQGRIAEMKTGEGKTTTALFPSYLNALTGKAVHIVTVNEYLAKFQGEQMGLVHKFLGLSVGVILHDMDPAARRAAYACDITYGTNNEFGFDYLRDNMALTADEMVQRGHDFAIVDEVDSILIDEARTPLIISGMGDESTDDYVRADAFVRRLKSFVRTEEDDAGSGIDYIFDKSARGGEHFDVDYTVDYVVNEKERTAQLTAAGIQKAEKYFGIDNLFAVGDEDAPFDTERIREANDEDESLSEAELADFDAETAPEAMTDEQAAAEAEAAARRAEAQAEAIRRRSDNRRIVHHIEQALKAHGLFKRDVNYVIQNGEVIIVDEFTGRLMYGRRYSEGLHQAIEAKEHVSIRRESKTLATITFQNYFRLYDKLSGMTGTAKTEEEEFSAIYGLDVIEIPTNRPMIRKDHPDMVFKTEKGKFDAVIEQIAACHEKGQPVLVGTVSIEKNELLSRLLKARGIPHNVLNAKQHEYEADIIAQAGKSGAVTIATNMAGRGTDILLGGNPELLAKKQLLREYFEGDGAKLKAETDAARLAYKQAVSAVMEPNGKNEPTDPGAVEIQTRVRGLRNRIAAVHPGWGKRELAAEMIRVVDSVFDKQYEDEVKSASEFINYESSSLTHTEDPRILDIRARYRAHLAEIKAVTDEDHKRVVEAGGLFVVGTERHESRRIDNQLRGRSGRQGDPGESRFFISMEDDLLRLFGGDRMKAMMDRLTGDEDVALDVRMLSNAIENAQGRIESRNFQTRKRVLEYDDVINVQRETIYKERHQVITGETTDEELREKILGMIRATVSGYAADAVAKYPGGRDKQSLAAGGVSYLISLLSPAFADEAWLRENASRFEGLSAEALGELLGEEAERRFDRREEEFGRETMAFHCRCVLLSQVTEKWMENIDDMDQLRTGITLRAYGQVDSVNVYKNEGFELYESMLARLRED